MLVSVKEVAVGTAVAVLVDATIVGRSLFPALLKLLGDGAWWAPRLAGRQRRSAGLRLTWSALALERAQQRVHDRRR